MLYAILRPITRIVLQGYYKKLFINGQHKIPRDKPVILAVNHPSAFTEPCVLATHLDRELHFLIRGDIINPKVKWFFDGTNQLPIYRFRDGFSSMRQNEKQFHYCFDLLARSGCIVIFAEGSTQHVKQTRPIQKGAARIAFGALQNRDLDDVCIVPVGVNFEHSPRARSMVAVEVGDPISVRNFYESYEKDERVGLKMVTNEIYMGLKPLMVHIEKQDRLEVANNLLLYASNEHTHNMYPVAEYENPTYFQNQDYVAQGINEISENQWNELKILNEKYEDELNAAGISDVVFPQEKRSVVWWGLMTPLALIGWLFLAPVYLLSFGIQNRLNRKDEYISGFRMAGFLLFIPVFLFLWMLMLFPVLGWWVFLLLVLLPVLSMVAIWWSDAFAGWREIQKWNRLSIEKRNELVNMRDQLMGRFCKI